MIPEKIKIDSEWIQQQHYERISQEYDAHYNDYYSQQYLQKIAFEPMFTGLDLSNKTILEAMCGGGQIAKYLLENKAQVTGLDISPQQLTHFKLRHQNSTVICGSMLDSGIKSESFDIVAVVGGIHHLPPNINNGILEIHRILKPDGYFCFMEPHTESVAQTFRQTWYQYDPLFAKNEEAINMSELHQTFQSKFEFKQEHYLGNFGYLFVLNSMVFRLPVKLKPVYSPFMIKLEMLFNQILGKHFSCFVAGQWQKK